MDTFYDKNHFDYLLFTTCDAQNEDRITDLVRLLSSLNTAIDNEEVNIKHYILLQRVESIPEKLINSFTRDNRHFMISNTRVSLSKARNIMIHQAIQDDAFNHASICAFPDDDAWYPNGFLSTLNHLFKLNPLVDLFVCSYSSTPFSNCHHIKDLALIKPNKINIKHIVRGASSNTLFITSPIALKTGYFDERLGVGAEINGGEDLDYVVRAMVNILRNKPINDGVRFTNRSLVGHRDKFLWVRSTYFSGSLFALARSARNHHAIFLQMLRKMAVGLFFVLKKEMTLKHYMKGIADAFYGYRTRSIKSSFFVE